MPHEMIVVTGAGGMVGSHVVDELQAQGRNVIGMGRPECNLLDERETLRVFRDIRPTHVFHSAACVYGIMGNINNPGQSFLENLRINTNVIESSRQIGVKKVTAMGTGCVYPFPPISTPLKEDDIFMGRPHPSEAGYAHAKLTMLAQLETYSHRAEMDFAYIVSCNLFGPRDKFDPVNGHVVPSLIRKFYEAKRDGTDVTVWGDGSARRDFIYIKDMARAAVMVMDKTHGPINFGTDYVARIGDIIKMISEISGVRMERVIWDKSKPNGVDYRGYDLTRLKALGFTPNYAIHNGLKETWDWYVEQRKMDAALDKIGVVK
jgi:GDP-L-fucose synthase